MSAYNKMYRFNHEFHNDSKGIEYKNFLGRNKVRRGAESVDDVIAWAELPEPYKKPKPLDMHPDAIAARRYMENHHA